MVDVHLPRSLARLFPECPGRLSLEAASVAELIDRLNERWPGIRDRLLDAGPVIRRHLNVFVDGERAGLATTLRPGAEVHILTAVSGG